MLLVCVLALGMLLGGPLAHGARSVVQAIRHFLLVGLCLVLGWIVLASLLPPTNTP